MTAFKQVARAFGSRKLATNFLTSNGVLSPAGLAIDATAEKFKTTTRSVIRYNGETNGKAATTAIVFSAAHPVTALKFGEVLVQQAVADGAITTKITGASQTTAMAYDSAALAAAARPTADAGNVAIGVIKIANNAVDWVANTDDLTAASDVTTATFESFPAMTFTT